MSIKGRIIFSLIVLYFLAAWCVTSADSAFALTYMEDFDTWTTNCAFNATPNDATCSSSGVLFTTRNLDGMSEGITCFRGVGKCPRWNMNDNGQYATAVLPNATSGVAEGIALNGTTMTLQMAFKVQTGFGWPRNAIKVLRFYDGCSFFRITLHGEVPPYGIAWATDCPTDGTEDSRNIDLVDFSAYEGMWLIWQGEINTATGAATLKIYESDGTPVLNVSDTFPDMVGHTIQNVTLPDYWTPDGALVGGISFPDPNYYWADEVRVCDAVGVGIGTLGECDFTFLGETPPPDPPPTLDPPVLLPVLIGVFLRGVGLWN